ncbi:MAG TPA: hypothetical protein VFV96_06170, partial [Verrucomicrobiae bacterium]|nr:hypothetical protein [Verrucomicrobiae bacterium]
MNATPAACDVTRIQQLRTTFFAGALPFVAGALFFAHAAAAAPDIIKNSDCLECHSDKTLTKTGPDGKEVSVFVDETLFKASVHRTNNCVSCHQDITTQHPDDNKPVASVDCARCHGPEANQYAASIHGVSHKLGASAAASCKDCHGTHEMLPVTHPASPV